MTSWARPEWLHQALSEVEGRPVPAPDQVEFPVRVARGEIRAAQPMDGEGGARLLLVLDVDPDHEWANAMLLSNLIEAATSNDVRLDPRDTGLRFAVLAETDVVGPLFVAQFGPRLGVVSDEDLRTLQLVQRGDDLEVLSTRRGLPVRSRRESRALWKGLELQTMHDLGGECLAHVVMKEETDPLVLVDDALFDIVETDAGAALGPLLQLVDSPNPLEVPAEAILDEGGELPEWLQALNPTEFAALEPLLVQALRETDIPPPAQITEATWRPERSAHNSSIVERYIAARVARGERSVRLATLARQWEGTTSRALKTGIIQLRIEGAGLVQVTPEILEEAI